MLHFLSLFSYIALVKCQVIALAKVQIILSPAKSFPKPLSYMNSARVLNRNQTGGLMCEHKIRVIFYMDMTWPTT